MRSEEMNISRRYAPLDERRRCDECFTLKWIGEFIGSDRVCDTCRTYIERVER